MCRGTEPLSGAAAPSLFGHVATAAVQRQRTCQSLVVGELSRHSRGHADAAAAAASADGEGAASPDLSPERLGETTTALLAAPPDALDELRAQLLAGVEAMCLASFLASPHFARAYVTRLVDDQGVLPADVRPDSVIINSYSAGDCIPPHVDHASYYRPISTLSLIGQEPMLIGSKFRTVRSSTWEPLVGLSVPCPR